MLGLGALGVNFGALCWVLGHFSEFGVEFWGTLCWILGHFEFWGTLGDFEALCVNFGALCVGSWGT